MSLCAPLPFSSPQILPGNVSFIREVRFAIMCRTFSSPSCSLGTWGVSSLEKEKQHSHCLGLTGPVLTAMSKAEKLANSSLCLLEEKV